MTTPAGLLDFFVLEGSEYVERLDGLLAGARGGQPEAQGFSQAARALRGTATMAKLGAMAELAGALERVARGLRDGQVAWSPSLRGAVVAAVDDAKLLIRAVRAWGPAEDERAGARTRELLQYAPERGGTPTPQAVGSVTFMATETDEVARAVDGYLSRPMEPDALAAMLQRVRALRGVAALKDLPPLAEVVEAVERAAKPMELAGKPAPLAPQQLALLTSAAELLHRAAGEIRVAGRPDASSPHAQRFAAAAAALDAQDGSSDHIMPVASLYFIDEGPHVVSRAPNPPTTPAERFRLEVVSQAEHLRRLVHDARASASDPTARARLARELRHALRALHAAADSFGEREVADFVGRVGEGATNFDQRALGELDEVARQLADPRSRSSELARRLEEFRAGERASERAAADASAAAVDPAKPTPASGKELRAMLKTSLDGLATIEQGAMDAAAGNEGMANGDGIVPIQALVYRGHAALSRARELRDLWRAQGRAPDPEALAELFDLLDLAAAE